MKIYEVFQDVVNSLKDIKIAWFTSFNLSPYFVEKYILPTLFKTVPKDIININDYEQLNEQLKSINAKFYCDSRAYEYEIKRTTFDLKQIAPEKIGLKFREGVFHPKVIFLQDIENKTFLISTSANLSIGGWGHNRECIIVKEVEDFENANNVLDFFQAIDKGNTSINDLRKWSGKLSQTTADWKFHHSISDSSFLDLVINKKDVSLHVWSPYFGSDLKKIFEETALRQLNEIVIIPDVSNDYKIRIDETCREYLNKTEKITLVRQVYNDPISNSALLTHAKVWLTENSLAIGSWNLTEAALNISNKGNNIEAGIIQNISGSIKEKFIQDIRFKKENNFIYSTIDEIQEEKSNLLQQWTEYLEIVADWNFRLYLLPKFQIETQKNLLIKLPGVSEKIKLSSFPTSGLSFDEYYKCLLKDRVFELYKNETIVYKGIITEINKESRPAYGFDTMSDYISAWLTSKPEENTDTQNPNYNLGDGDPSDVIKNGNENSDPYTASYYAMFLALDNIRLRIDNISNNENSMKFLGYVMPGSILQLKEHVGTITKTTDISLVYKWFLINESNSIIKKYNTAIEKHHLQIGLIDLIAGIDILDIMQNADKKKNKKWIKFIKEKCSY